MRLVYRLLVVGILGLMAVLALVSYTLGRDDASAWDRMVGLCRAHGGVAHSYVEDIAREVPCVERVKCWDGSNLGGCR